MAIVKKYKASIVSIKNKIDGVYTLELKSLSRPFKYLPGQFLHLALDEYDPSNAWPESRCFSMQTSPSDANIKITYAVKGNFTKRMAKTLNDGTEIWIKLPYGDLFTQEHDKANTIFVAGGTGITPFLSLFNDTSFEEYKDPKIYLGFRNNSMNIYNEDLVTFRTKFKSFCEPNIFYEDQVGKLDIEIIFKENGMISYYFISGPPLMIKTFKQKLIEKNVPEKQILTDDWE
jgi:NAD(P)H-flavin reductase